MPAEGGTTLSGLGPPISLINQKMPNRHSHLPNWWRGFFSWGFLFPDDSFASTWQKLTGTNCNYIIIFNVWNLKLFPSINLQYLSPYLTLYRRNPTGDSDSVELDRNLYGPICEHYCRWLLTVSCLLFGGDINISLVFTFVWLFVYIWCMQHSSKPGTGVLVYTIIQFFRHLPASLGIYLFSIPSLGTMCSTYLAQWMDLVLFPVVPHFLPL